MISAGYRFAAVRRSEDRVLKIQLPRAYEKLLSRAETVILGSEHDFADQSHLNEIKKLEARGVPRNLLGNPRILRESRPEIYTQDRATPTRRKLNEIGAKTVSESYLDFLEFCISYGFYDKTWNLFNNTGFVGNKMVLLDPGELGYGLDGLVNDLREKKYLNQHDWERMDEKEKETFVDALESLTVHNVRKLWKTDVEKENLD